MPNLKHILISICLLLSTKVLCCDPVVNLGSVISFCQGNSISLNAYNPNSTYLWNTGANTSTLTVSTSGVYWVAVTNPCGTTRDTVQVVVDQPINLNLGTTVEACQGHPYTIQAPYSISNTYLWQDGSLSSSIQATTSGQYWVEVTNSCGIYRDTVQVNFVTLPNLNLGPDIVRCNSSPTTISAGNVGYPVKWSTSQTTNSITFNFSATFWAEATNVCGTVRDSISVHYSKPPDLGDTISLCTGGSLNLTVNNPLASLLWNTGATTQTITITQAGQYWVKQTDACGVFYDTVTVVNSGQAGVNLGPDIELCIGNSIQLDAGFPGSAYVWKEKGSTPNFITVGSTQKVSIDTAGIFVAGVNNGCGWHYDTIEVKLLEIPHQVFDDTVGICQGSWRFLDAGDWGKTSSYLWDDGSTNRINSYSGPGAHWVRITNKCGTYLNNFHLRYDQTYSINLGPDDTICSETYSLDGGSFLTTDTILWSTGENNSSIEVDMSGTYWFKVSNACGVFTDTIDLVFLNPVMVNLPDATLCSGGSHTIGIPHQPGTSYLWSTGAKTASVTITQAGKYWARWYNKCDTISDTLYVEIDYPINFSLGPDITICDQQIVPISVGNLQNLGADSIKWNTGDRTSTIVVSAPGTYVASLYNTCGIFRDTIEVFVNQLPDSKLSDTSYCVGGGLGLKASTPNISTTFKWNTGASTDSIYVNTSGTYWVEMTNACGTVTDSIYVREDLPLPKIDLGNDTVFCSGTLWLDPGDFPGATYTWQNGFNSQKFVVAQSGTFHVKVENSCGAAYDTINVLITGPPTESLGTTVQFCNGHSLILDAENPGCTYLWNTGARTKQISVNTPGKYWVEIKNNCGELTDSVDVEIEFAIENLDLGQDTVICAGEELVLDPGYPGVERLWNNGAATPTLTVNQTGTYWVRLTNTCGAFWDSIYVEVEGTPVFSLGADTVMCEGGYLELAGPEGMQSYEWSQGGNQRLGIFDSSGTYWLKVSNHCYSYTDTIFIEGEYPISIDLGPDTTICETQSYILDAGVSNYTVHWDNQSTGNLRPITKTGWYWAYAENSCGRFSDSVYVQIDTIINPLYIKTVLCREDSLIMDLSDYIYDFVWFDGSTEKIRAFSDEGIYPITVYNKCGTFQRDFEIILSNCDCPVFIANSFTPNGDGLNDEFKVLHDCMIKEYSIEIFSRWGTSVYYSENPDEVWDGTFNGKELPSDVYTYKIFYKWNVYHLDRKKLRHGRITLLR